MHLRKRVFDGISDGFGLSRLLRFAHLREQSFGVLRVDLSWIGKVRATARALTRWYLRRV